MTRSTAFTAGAAAILLLGPACTSSTYVSSTPPDVSASTAAAASPSPTPTPTPLGPLTIASVPVHNGEIGLGFAPITLTGDGGAPPYSWAVGTGALPTGLSLSAEGVISGQLTKDGTFKFTVALADSGGHQASVATAITIYKALKLTAPCAQVCVIGRGCAKCGTFGTVTGGAGPLAYRITGGSLPPGMAWSNLALKGGFPAGSFGLTVQVSDQLGVHGTVSANWNIYGPATLTAGSACSSMGNPPQCTTTGWSYSGGHPTVAPKLVILSYAQYCPPGTACLPVPTGPPQGWTVTVKAGVITISAGGLPCTPNVPYGGILTLALVDTTSCPTTSQSNPGKLTVFLENNC